MTGRLEEKVEKPGTRQAIARVSPDVQKQWCKIEGRKNVNLMDNSEDATFQTEKKTPIPIPIPIPKKNLVKPPNPRSKNF